MAEKKVRLISNFYDYYDHEFDVYNAELTFERKSTGGMARREMLEYLQSLGFVVPVFGKPTEIHDRLPAGWQVVVHLDETSHRGEDKIKLPLREAAEQYHNHLAVEYIPSLPDGLGQTWRHLQIGDKVFWLEYTSQNDWRSNCGDVEIRLFSHMKDGYHPWIDYPLFAIDFILIQDTAYAIDFNIAPGVRGTGVENILPAAVAAEAIKKVVRR